MVKTFNWPGVIWHRICEAISIHYFYNQTYKTEAFLENIKMDCWKYPVTNTGIVDIDTIAACAKLDGAVCRQQAQ